MKKLLILLGILGLTGCSNANSDSIQHSKSIDARGQFVTLICVNGVEYITTQPEMQAGIAITLSVDKDGKPKQCTY